MSEDPLKGLTPLELAAQSIETRKIDWQTFTTKPVEEFYWSVWRLYFNLMLRDEITNEQAAAMFKELRNRRFTNGDLSVAGEIILGKNRRWPVLADFMATKDTTVD